MDHDEIREDDIEEEEYRDPSLSAQFDQWIGTRHVEQPILGGETMSLVQNLIVRSRVIWTYQEIMAILINLANATEELIQAGAIRFRDEDGDMPVPVAEGKADPETASMYDALINGVPDVPEDWMEE